MTEAVAVFQKRWASNFEQQVNFCYHGSMIRAYRRYLDYRWTQEEIVLFYDGEKYAPNKFMRRFSQDEVIHNVHYWTKKLYREIEVQSCEWLIDDRGNDICTEVVDCYFHHFSRCKGEHYLVDRVKRIHRKVFQNEDFIEDDKAFNYQYEVFIPLKPIPAFLVHDRISIIIPFFNNKKGLLDCLRSLENHSELENEIIIVNDGDADLSDLQGNYRIIKNRERRGFGESCNAGIRASKGKYICLLNDDTEVATPGWDRKMRSVLIDDVLIAGPLTNRSSGYPAYQDDGLEDIGAADIELCYRPTRVFSDARSESKILTGFCYMVRRDAFERFGLLDSEQYPWGYGEENAYTHLVMTAGYKCALVGNVFVWHERSITFNECAPPIVDLSVVKKKNIIRLLRNRQPRVVAYCRVKNEAFFIEEQLRRLLSWCDRVVVHDTGSNDDTVKIARSLKRVDVIETTDKYYYNMCYQLNVALHAARISNPEWLLYFDVDQFYDDMILTELDALLSNDSVDIWSFRLYDGRFCDELDEAQESSDFIYHTRKLCEPCYRIVPTLFRNNKDLIVAKPEDWAWSKDKSIPVFFEVEHNPLPIQYIDFDLSGHFKAPHIARTVIRHMGLCSSPEKLNAKAKFYTNKEWNKDYPNEWDGFKMQLPRQKLMEWNERKGTKVAIGSHVKKYLAFDPKPQIAR